MNTKVLVVVLFALLWAGAGAGAQQAEKEEPVLRGRVVDLETGNPLLGAWVHLQGEDWGVLTEADGSFELPRVRPGTLRLSAEQLGYEELVQTVAFPQEKEGVVLALVPDPIVLEGIQVMTDRFERRVEAQPTFSQVLRRDRLVNSSAFDLLALLASTTFLNPVRCYSRATSAVENTCAVIRGRIRRVRVYLDEMPVVGGLDFVSLFSPHELHRVEVYHSLGQVRLYTEGFMRWASHNRLALTPIGR